MQRLRRAMGWGLAPAPAAVVSRRQTPAEAVRVIEELAKSCDQQCIGHLLNALAHADDKVIAAAEGALCSVERQLSALQIPQLDEQIRGSSWRAMTWHDMDPRDAKRSWSSPVLALFTLHSNGYVRQWAVELLERSESERALPYLLLRLNDWVAEVRVAANRAVRARLKPELAAEWAPCLGLVEVLLGRGRANHVWLGVEVARLLRHPAARPVLEAQFRSEDRRTARAAFRIALKLEPAERDRFLVEAMEHVDPVLRLHAARLVRASKDMVNREEFLRRMARDSFMPVRREALYEAAEQSPSEAQRQLVNALADPHASMREAARFYLKQVTGGSFDARAFSVGRLCEMGDGVTAAQVSAVGETGRPEDADLVLPYVKHRRATVARAAVRAVAALHGDRFVRLFHECMSDSRPGVALAGSQALAARRGAVEWEEIRELARHGRYSHNRARALALLLSRHPHDSMPDAIEASCSEDEAVASTAREYLRFDWIRRPSHAPSPAKAQAIIAALAVFGDRLHADLAERIRRFAL